MLLFEHVDGLGSSLPQINMPNMVNAKRNSQISSWRFVHIGPNQLKLPVRTVVHVHACIESVIICIHVDHIVGFN